MCHCCQMAAVYLFTLRSSIYFCFVFKASHRSAFCTRATVTDFRNLKPLNAFNSRNPSDVATAAEAVPSSPASAARQMSGPAGNWGLCQATPGWTHAHPHTLAANLYTQGNRYYVTHFVTSGYVINSPQLLFFCLGVRKSLSISAHPAHPALGRQLVC